VLVASSIFLFLIQNHAGVIENPITELTVGGEPCVVYILDVVSFEPVTPLVGTFLSATGLVIAATGKQFMTYAAIHSNPHTDIPVLIA
jgi:hypothetical protein